MEGVHCGVVELVAHGDGMGVTRMNKDDLKRVCESRIEGLGCHEEAAHGMDQ